MNNKIIGSNCRTEIPIYNKWYFKFFFNMSVGYFLFKNELDFIYYKNYEYIKKDFYESTKTIKKTTDVKNTIFKLIMCMISLLIVSQIFIDLNTQKIILLILIELSLLAIVIKYLIHYYIYKLCEEINDYRYTNEVTYNCDDYNPFYVTTKNGIVSSFDYGEIDFKIINYTNQSDIKDNIQILLKVYEIPAIIKSHINNDNKDFIIDILNRELLPDIYKMKPTIIITYK